ncbi:MAG: hypothetical protein GKR88_20705 [Flavobacteriaceae bacterium]|nr:MAG: hypothetical protein GKR88_20705 [Flavobacteriaceae bacterium]
MIGNRKINLDEICIGLVLFTLPVSMKLNSIILIITSAYFTYKILKVRTLKNIRFYGISILFFAAQLLSFFLSVNNKEAEEKLILYLSFIIFPFIFSYAQSNIKLEKFRLFKWLFYGIITVLIYGLIRFLYDIVVLDARYDYGRGVALFLKYIPHHIYFSMYVLISIYIVVLEFLENRKSKVLMIFVPVLFLSLILLSSRMAIALSILVLPPFIYYKLNHVINRRKAFIVIFSTVLLLTIIGFSNKFARDRILYTYYEITDMEISENPFSGISFREKIWKGSIYLIKKSPWIGYGVGDTQRKLNDSYKSFGFEEVIWFNAHNQYLQLILHHGLLIVLLLFVMLFLLLKKLVKKKAHFVLFCWLIIGSFSLTESILSRQWGVILFAFVLNYSIYLAQDETKEII